MTHKMDPSELADELNKYEPGFLPEPLFIAIARLAVLVAVEFVPLRHTASGGVEVLLMKRPKTDPFWPGMLHTPGTMLRPNDKGFESAFHRLFKDELRSDYIEPIFIGIGILESKRGMITTIKYIIPFEGEPNEGTFYNTDVLTGLLIDEQLPMVQQAAEKFLAR